MTDIVDAISALVDEQLAAGPVDDYNADRYDKCPHCGRSWHGLPVTERIADMYAVRRFDESYSVAEDDSRVLCRGSDFIGPMPDERRYETAGWTASGWAPTPPRLESSPWSYREFFAPVPVELRWWRLPQVPEGALLQHDRTGDNEVLTLTVGDRISSWGTGYFRANLIRTDNLALMAQVDVLADVAPDIGGTWEPLTAPGSTRHPDDPPLQQTGMTTGGHFNEGDRISVAMPDGQIFTYQRPGQWVDAALETTWRYLDEATRTIMGINEDTE